MELYKKEGDGKDYILQFEKSYLKHFGGWKLSQITRGDLFEFKKDIKKTPKQRGGWNYTLRCKCKATFEQTSKKCRCPECSLEKNHKVIKKEKKLSQVTDSTLNRSLAGLRKLFHFAMSKEYLEESPFPKDPKSGLFLSEKANRGKRNHFTEDEVRKIVEACPDWLKPFVIIAYLTGMRAGELLQLKWKNVNLKDGVILLEKTKAMEPQVVKMQDDLIELFKNLPKRSDLVFCQADGNPLKHWHYYKLFKKALRVIGKDEKGWNFHTLRHSTGTNLYLKGVPAIAIKDQLRHSDIRVTTGYYIGYDSEYQKTQIEKLSHGYFRELLKDSEVRSEKTVKKEVDFEALQGVPPIASA
jgi:integrase